MVDLSDGMLEKMESLIAQPFIWLCHHYCAAAAAELLRVMVVVGIFVQVSHFCARKAENETT
jgi:hypothetical protein